MRKAKNAHVAAATTRVSALEYFAHLRCND